MELCNLKHFITANHQEKGSRFLSFTAKTHTDTFIKLLSYLILAFLIPAKIKDKLHTCDPSLCLYHAHGAICAVNIKELLRIF